MIMKALHALFLEHPTICTDTRKITENCLFFALKGPNFNGNAFAQEALDKGAAYAIIDQEEFKTSDRLLLVDDVLDILQQLSTYHRNYSKAKVISLTGSNGKTTTKELISAVISKKYKTIATKGNLNNHIGVPLTLLSIKEDTEMAIVEMGANHIGEIGFLSTIAQPDFGYITNFGKAHLEGFGGAEGVIKGKSELYDYLKTNDKYIFLNADDDIQKEKLSTYTKKMGFSTNDHHYYNIKFLGVDPYVLLEMEGIQITTQLVGKYNFPNCCAAILMGKYFNVPLEDIKSAIERYQPQNNRSQILSKNGFDIVLDAYNANPTSMKAALENFSLMNADRKTLILGDMFELGNTASEEHQAIAELAKELGFDDAYLVGGNFHDTNTTLNKFKSFEDLKVHLSKKPLKKGALLIKGSRGMALERVLDFL
ncbi:UDP-N-acetylmuramoyl-tripeptide--D-alanyl-D-alanine ligase [Flagellimonas halotolerans]|uniref:UDP-N-acetylmuramoyl-tripeptide--D-alanyl-D-alanine ligase n=1 Tax=Flagellimonas halotolerans TaxID=3112164 RepID=A0ABU6ISW1_9FLAO|nr:MULTISPECIES: UDP-N-acetylmuramoyl-tripeptide--D-alanyl-D-alanine ligase [unclassified Allomuricauda]MEC3966348.1 UDP-N-acetylmuramoyl-tripeptide--D-alanyl-D-alanine ligase [Muricauda sp. SYSU M86414]MEC4266213.1 UDP-N-acetylmuramoyl-tripeptide--D-alanyl-D-alanine ligase [Muricauda sp. SYSU M84420]